LALSAMSRGTSVRGGYCRRGHSGEIEFSNGAVQRVDDLAQHLVHQLT
jgi:hypothetical protein